MEFDFTIDQPCGCKIIFETFIVGKHPQYIEENIYQGYTQNLRLVLCKDHLEARQ